MGLDLTEEDVKNFRIIAQSAKPYSKEEYHDPDTLDYIDPRWLATVARDALLEYEKKKGKQ